MVKEAQIFEFKGLTGKIRKTKEIALSGIVSSVETPSNYGGGGGALSQRLSWEFREGVPQWEGTVGVDGKEARWVRSCKWTRMFLCPR